MSDRIYVYPALGLVIRDEHTAQPIPEDGLDVPVTRLTARRLARKDLLLVDPRPAASPAPKKSKKDEV